MVAHFKLCIYFILGNFSRFNLFMLVLIIKINFSDFFINFYDLLLFIVFLLDCCC